MTTLVVGANGATGRQLVQQLLNQGQCVRVIVRSAEKLPGEWHNTANLQIIEGSIVELQDADLQLQVSGCNAVASCLGHNLTFKGIFGPPRRLVTDAVRRLCAAIEATAPTEPEMFVLMNTSGNSNRDLAEPVSFAQTVVIWLLRHLLPPHADNEQAADYLRTQIGQHHASVEWSVVRPDTLVNESSPGAYRAYPSPIRSAIFNAGKTSRANVGHFMAQLITDADAWAAWRGQMPVIYNTSSP